MRNRIGIFSLVGIMGIVGTAILAMPLSSSAFGALADLPAGDHFALTLLGGVNLGTQTVSPTSATYGTALGASTGLQFGMMFLPWLGAETGVFFALRNSAYSFTVNQLTTNVVLDHQGLIFPLNAKFRIFIDSLEARTGLYFGVGIGSITTNTSTSGSTVPSTTVSDYPSSSISVFDLGLLEGISYRYNFAGTWGLVGDIRYLYGLLNIDMTGQVFQAYRDFQVHVGLDFRF